MFSITKLFMAWTMVVGMLMPLVGCGNECSFNQRCNGNVLETCGEGPDQMFNRTVSSRECADPNPICVEYGPNLGRARCVREPAELCDENSLQPYCDGNVRVACTRGTSFSGCGDGSCPPEQEGWYITGTDCTQGGPECVETEESAVCARTPPVECDEATYTSSCDGDVTLVICRDGLVSELLCEEGLSCQVGDDGESSCELE
jgi:hypothetical protein